MVDNPGLACLSSRLRTTQTYRADASVNASKNTQEEKELAQAKGKKTENTSFLLHVSSLVFASHV